MYEPRRREFRQGPMAWSKCATLGRCSRITGRCRIRRRAEELFAAPPARPEHRSMPNLNLIAPQCVSNSRPHSSHHLGIAWATAQPTQKIARAKREYFVNHIMGLPPALRSVRSCILAKHRRAIGPRRTRVNHGQNRGPGHAHYLVRWQPRRGAAEPRYM
jgi:hypothetical protein